MMMMGSMNTAGAAPMSTIPTAPTGTGVSTEASQNTTPVPRKPRRRGSGVMMMGSMNVAASTLTTPPAPAVCRPRRGSVIRPRMYGPGSGPETQGSESPGAFSPSGKTAATGDQAKRQKRKERGAGRKAIHAITTDVSDYVKKVVPKSDNVRDLIYHAIKPNILFKACSEEELIDLVDVFEPKFFKAGSIVIREGDEGHHFYVMERGGVNVYEKDVFKVSLFSGVAFGEIALLYGCPRSATLQAKYDCSLWSIDRTAFRGISVQHKQKRMELKLAFLREVKIDDRLLGDVLKPSELAAMASATEIQCFREGDCIVEQGTRGDIFYMIEEGTVDVFIKEKGDRPVVTLTSGQFFGEKALLSDDVRTASCIASSDVKCMILMREDFVLMLGDLQDLLNRSYRNRESSSAGVVKDALKEADVIFTKFEPAKYDIKRTLGVGAFGYVKLVKINQPDSELERDNSYALKCISKKKIAELKQEDKLTSEASIMTELKHPFIARCYDAMQDEKFNYFLMEALCGGEICELLFNEEQFSEDWSRFYAASVLHAFNYMHHQKIAYRDLKTENLVLNAAGYMKIVDFGLAKKIPVGKTWTFCGTPEYLAPEIILNEGHDWAVDYWALGILIFEMVAGEVPFFSENPMELYKKVLSGSITVPDHFSVELESLISELLNKYQSKRLGRTMGGGLAVMEHAWFSGFDWDSLLQYQMKVPVVPKVKDENDTSFIDEDPGDGFAAAM